MLVIFIFLTLCLYFLFHFIRLSGGKLKNWIKGIRAVSKMSSDSAFRNCLEVVLFALMFIGLYVLITVSNLIETEIRTLDILRGKNTKRNTELVASQQAPYEV
uniref:Uncharacterized protein n=1 Tax=Strombidium inclinatum TaxID=197538 RepID=A0A7S3IFG0_9SPIT|mmetsp:Transcript_15940/g.24649  ORF Transcript_15940/g.24649 Transcript_15940/m.24649 type:complete len:103 (+) Transcript_15940:598-906(+)